MRKVGVIIGFVLIVLCSLNYFEQTKAGSSVYFGFHPHRGCHGGWGWSCYHPYCGYRCRHDSDFGWGFGSGILLGAAVGSAAHYEPESAQDIARRTQAKKARALAQEMDSIGQKKARIVRKSENKQKSLRNKLKRKRNSSPEAQRQLEAQLLNEQKRLDSELKALVEREAQISRTLEDMANAE